MSDMESFQAAVDARLQEIEKGKKFDFAAMEALQLDLVPPRDLTPSQAEQVFELLFRSSQSIKGHPTPEGHKLLKFLLYLLLNSPQMNEEIERAGILYFQGAFKLLPYLDSPNTEYGKTVGEMVAILVANLPGFAQWEDLFRADSVWVQEQIQRPLGLVKPADHVAGPKELAHLRQLFSAHPSQDPLQGTLRDSRHLQAKDLEEKERAILKDIEELQVEFTQARLKEEEVMDTKAGGLSSSLPFRFLDGKFAELVEVQTLGRRAKADLFTKRRLLIQSDHLTRKARTSEATEVISVFQQNLDRQMQVQGSLERLYTIFAKNTDLLFLKDDLCLLHTLLKDLYDMSVSISVAGLINVGKSTVVNCLIGQQVAPSRQQTLTAIPIRYLHDPFAQEPMMLVPFHQDLNILISRLRQFLEGEGESEGPNLSSFTHLGNLADLIRSSKLYIAPRYEGAEAINEVSAHIHDLFRLAVQPNFPEELRGLLPTSWSQGLQHYLTVCLCFPELDVSCGLISLSVIDTPGIDEDGVEQLDLYGALGDAISLSNFTVMVTSPGRFEAVAMASLRDLIHQALAVHQVQALALVTHGDLVQSQEKRSLEENILGSLTTADDPPVPLFGEGELFIASPFQKLLATRMRSYITAHQEKPTSTGSSLAQKLLEDWIGTGSYGLDGERLYALTKIPQLLEQCDKLVKMSGMQQPTQQIIDRVVKNAASLGVQKALTKAEDLLHKTLRRLETNTSDLTPERAASLKDQLQAVESIQDLVYKEIRKQANDIERRLEKRCKELQETLRTFILDPSVIPDSKNPKDLAFHLNRELAESGARDFFEFSKDTLVLDSEEDFVEPFVDLCQAIKNALVRALDQTLEGVPSELYQFCSDTRSTFFTTMLHVGVELGSEDVPLPPLAGSFSAASDKLTWNPSRSFFQYQTKLPVSKNSRKVWSAVTKTLRLGSKKKPAAQVQVQLTRDAFRAELVAHSKKVLEALENDLSAQLIKVVDQTLIEFRERMIALLLDLQSVYQEQLLGADQRQFLTTRKLEFASALRVELDLLLSLTQST